MIDIPIEKMIKLHDTTLLELRADWMAAVNKKNQSQIDATMKRINSALDYRLELMKIRKGGE